MRYFVLRDTGQFGPFETEEIRELISLGSLLSTDMAVPEEGGERFPVMNLFPAASPPKSLPGSAPGTTQSYGNNYGRVDSPQPFGAVPSVPPSNGEDPFYVRDTYSASNYTSPGYSTPSNSYPANPAPANFQPSYPTSPPAGYQSGPGIGSKPAPATPVYRPNDIYNQAIEITREKFFSWLLITFLPVVFIVLVIFKTVSLMKGGAGQEDLQNFSGDIIQLVIFSLLLIYSYLTSFVMMVIGVSEYTDGGDFTLIELFQEAQPRIPKFFVSLLLMTLALSVISLPFQVLPQEGRIVAFILMFILIGLVMIRFFPLLFIIVLQERSIPDTFRYCLAITRGHSFRIFLMFLLLLFLQGIVGFITNILIFVGIAGIAVQIYGFVLTIAFFKDLEARAQANGIY